MEATLNALGGLLLKAIPTFLLVIVLHFYLKRMFFRPLARVLQERYEATEGARKLAQDSLEKASAKAAEYEQALRAARSEIYREQEDARQRRLQEQAEAIQRARKNAEAMINDAKAKLDTELVIAKQVLERQSDALAEQIARNILYRRAS